MKMITAIVNKDDSKIVNAELLQAGFTVTKLSTTGSFLMAGNVTMMIGTEDEKVDDCIDIIARFSRQRTEVVPSTANYTNQLTANIPLEVSVGGATIFVTDVERFEKV